VQVTPSSATLASLGETVQLAASALDASGNAIPGKTFTWWSSYSSVATVTSTGLVTAAGNGSVTITASTDGISGTASLDVDQAATHLAFSALPTVTYPGLPIAPAVEVELRDALESAVTDATDAVTIAIAANPSGGSLLGTTTVNAVMGTATFTDVTVNQAGIGYTFEATSGSLETATSAPFDVWGLTSVSVGGEFTCGLAIDANIYCWGKSQVGQLGNGTMDFDPHRRPTMVSGGLTFASVDAGRSHICGLTPGGEAYCWGSNEFGELGDGAPTVSQTTPVSVVGGLTFATISAGEHNTCGVATDGVTYCWGLNDDGSLGDGTTTSQSTPVLVSGGHSFGTVSATRHSCAITAGTGIAYCWGYNAWGQLGIGTSDFNPHSFPVAVSGNLSFASLGTNLKHTCGVTMSGDAYCWGEDHLGRLGTGMALDPSVPQLVVGGLKFASVAPGDEHTCGVTHAGAAYCWGRNWEGQLGTGASDTDSHPTPLAVSGGLTFTLVSAGGGGGGGHTCGITTSGAAYCWGSNFWGQLGDRTTSNRPIPIAVQW
jgi:alpha-tubulin suppressor-like RCC1 family protein